MSISLFSGLSSLARVALGSFSKAAFVGANTVKGPSPDNVSTRSAALSALTNVDKDLLETASSAIVLVALDPFVEPPAGGVVVPVGGVVLGAVLGVVVGLVMVPAGGVTAGDPVGVGVLVGVGA